MKLFLSGALSLLLLGLPSVLKADIVFDVNLSGLSDGVDGFASPSQLSVFGTITVNPDGPVDASNFSSDLTFSREEPLFIGLGLSPPILSSLTEVTFSGDTAANLDYVVVDDELFIRRIGTEDSRLDISSDSIFSPTSLTFGSGPSNSSGIGFIESGGFIGFFDSFVLREAGGIDTDNGVAVNAAAVPEPSSFALLGLCGVAMMLRRRNRCHRV